MADEKGVVVPQKGQRHGCLLVYCQQLLKMQPLALQHVQHLALDEADHVLGRTVHPSLTNRLGQGRVKLVGTLDVALHPLQFFDQVGLVAVEGHVVLAQHLSGRRKRGYRGIHLLYRGLRLLGAAPCRRQKPPQKPLARRGQRGVQLVRLRGKPLQLGPRLGATRVGLRKREHLPVEHPAAGLAHASPPQRLHHATRHLARRRVGRVHVHHVAYLRLYRVRSPQVTHFGPSPRLRRAPPPRQPTGAHMPRSACPRQGSSRAPYRRYCPSRRTGRRACGPACTRPARSAP